MKSATRMALWLPLAAAALAACEGSDNASTSFDPRYDGVTPNSLSVNVDRSILDPQQAQHTATPVTVASTAPATTAPAATSEVAPPVDTPTPIPTADVITPTPTPDTATPPATTPPTTPATATTAPGAAAPTFPN